MFDWTTFLDQHHIDYVKSRTHATIKCVWCGADDPSQHLGISLEGKGYHCWRNQQHSGKSNARLVQALINCSWEQACRIVGSPIFAPVDDFEARINAILDTVRMKKLPELHMPPEFKALSKLPSCINYRSYLKFNRDYTDDQIDAFWHLYDMRYCTSGPFSGRIIFPVKMHGRLMTWTGRTIYKANNLRYKTLSADAEKAKAQGLPRAIGPITDYLLWFDDLLTTDANTIYLCEGPFDALRVNTLGRKRGITATCFFTSAPHTRQVDLLHEVLPRFEHRFVLLDRQAWASSAYTVSQLAALDVVERRLPDHLKDPGEMTEKDLEVLDTKASLA